jgi:hypothetical protein
VINFDKEQLGGRFCFVQTEDGQTPVVFHTKGTSQWVINLQKALVTGFQANFAGKAEVAETDHESEHISHYRSAWKEISVMCSESTGTGCA